MHKTLFLLAALACTAPHLTQAQQAATKTPEQRADRQAQYLAKELALSADQQPKVESILTAQMQEMSMLRQRQQAGGQRQGAGRELKAARDKYDEQLRAVMTPEQFSKYTQIRAERAEKVRSRRKG